jgi:signal transduction histidine kinase
MRQISKFHVSLALRLGSVIVKWSETSFSLGISLLIWYATGLCEINSLQVYSQNHMIFEILKNSLRAVIERFGPEADSYPPIKVIVATGNEDITIKISDEGGGIPRSAIPLVWTYM